MSNVKKYRNLPVFFVDEYAFENDVEMKNAIKKLSKALSEIDGRTCSLRTCKTIAIHALLGTVSLNMLIDTIRGVFSIPAFVHATRLIEDDEYAIKFAEEYRKDRPKYATVFEYKTL